MFPESAWHLKGAEVLPMLKAHGRWSRWCMLGLLATTAAGCSDADDERPFADFVVAVGSERFVLRSRNPETIRLADDNLAGRNQMFPIGPLRRGDGGFNRPWSWHLDPDETRFTEAAIEVCDGTPSYVEAHVADFPTYCPWSARVVARR